MDEIPGFEILLAKTIRIPANIALKLAVEKTYWTSRILDGSLVMDNNITIIFRCQLLLNTHNPWSINN